jgi:hypothetical protein
VIAEEGIHATPPVDQYKKGALFLNTVRSIVNDDAVWFKLLHDYHAPIPTLELRFDDAAHTVSTDLYYVNVRKL